MQRSFDQTETIIVHAKGINIIASLNRGIDGTDETRRAIGDNPRDCHLYAPAQLRDTAMQSKQEHPLIHNTWNGILCPRLCDGDEMNVQ